MHAAPVDVSNEAGGVKLSHSGEGTDIDPLKGGGGPGKPYQWPTEKIARVIANQFWIGLKPRTGSRSGSISSHSGYNHSASC